MCRRPRGRSPRRSGPVVSRSSCAPSRRSRGTWARRAGRAAGRTVEEAYTQLGAAVPIFLDGGEVPGGVASTIVDATGDVLRIVRSGAITLEALRAVAPVEVLARADVLPDDDDAVPDDAVPDDAVPDDAVPDDVAADAARPVPG